MPPTENKRYTVSSFEFPPPDYPSAIGAAYSKLVRINDGYADEKSFICIDEGFRAAIRYVEEKLTAHNSAMVQFTASQMHCAAKDAGLHGQDIDDLISAIGKQHQ